MSPRSDVWRFILLYSLIIHCAITQGLPSTFTDGLVAYFPCDGSVDDQSSYNFASSVYGITLTNDRFGNAQSACSFGGSAYISLDIHSIPNNNSFTAMVWVQSNTGIISGKRPIFDRWPDWRLVGEDGIDEQGWLSGPGIEFGYVDGGVRRGIGLNQPEATDLLDNWTQFVAVYDENNNHTVWYINGEVIGTNIFNTRNPSSNNVFIGRKHPPTNTYFIGSMDDILVFNRSLSMNEVQEFYNITLHRSYSGKLAVASAHENK